MKQSQQTEKAIIMSHQGSLWADVSTGLRCQEATKNFKTDVSRLYCANSSLAKKKLILNVCPAQLM